MTAANVSTTPVAIDKAAVTAHTDPARRIHRNAGDRLFFALLRVAAALPILLMIVFVGVLIYGAWPSIHAFGISFLFSSDWDPNPDHEQYGAQAFIYGTLVSSFFALLLAAPIGIGVAAFLSEVFPSRLRSIVTFLIEILATIPSIVYGVWAFFVLRDWVQNYIQPAFTHTMGSLHVLVTNRMWAIPSLGALLLLVLWPTIWAVRKATAWNDPIKAPRWAATWRLSLGLALLLAIVYTVLGFGTPVEKAVGGFVGTNCILFSGPPLGLGLLTGTLVLATMILPVIVSISLDAIRAVPASYREAALGLGATRWEMIRLAVLPAARSGLLGGCILALGRALGETMAITMVIGNANTIGWSLFQPANTISSAIASQFGEAEGLMLSSLIELAMILFLMTLAINLIARTIIRKISATKGLLA